MQMLHHDKILKNIFLIEQTDILIKFCKILLKQKIWVLSEEFYSPMVVLLRGSETNFTISHPDDKSNTETLSLADAQGMLEELEASIQIQKTLKHYREAIQEAKQKDQPNPDNESFDGSSDPSWL